jgi:hypothetical protein
MSLSVPSSANLLAQAPAKPTAKSAKTSTIASGNCAAQAESPWMYVSGGLGVVILLLGIFSTLQHRQLRRNIKVQSIKNQQLQTKVKSDTETISKMEKNPDLVHSRDFNLDYLRMRMGEEVFHFSIVNQIKNKVRDKISQALRPQQANQGALGIANTSGRQIDEIFDVEYEPKDAPKGTKRVLFRIEIKIVKLPTQPTSVTISQIIDCIETFLSPAQENDTWQPTIQGRIANIRWDQKAKPTPMLVLEQTQEGANVTFRTQRMANK